VSCGLGKRFGNSCRAAGFEVEGDVELECVGIGVENAAAGRAGAQDLAADGTAQAAVSFEAAHEALGDIIGNVGESVIDFGDRVDIGEGQEDVAVGGVGAKRDIRVRGRDGGDGKQEQQQK